MKKNNTAPQSPRGGKRVPQPITIGMDLGDRTSRYCELSGWGIPPPGWKATLDFASPQAYSLPLRIAAMTRGLRLPCSTAISSSGLSSGA